METLTVRQIALKLETTTGAIQKRIKRRGIKPASISENKFGATRFYDAKCLDDLKTIIKLKKSNLIVVEYRIYDSKINYMPDDYFEQLNQT